MANFVVNPGGKMIRANIQPNQQRGIAPPRTVNVRGRARPINTKFTNGANTPGNFGRLANKLAQSNGQ